MLSLEARAHLDSDDKRRCTHQARREAELVDAAGALPSHEAVEASLAPVRTPAVLDEPVALPVLLAEAHDRNPVVELRLSTVGLWPGLLLELPTKNATNP